MADNEERMEDLRRILAGREALYSKADARVDTAGKATAQGPGAEEAVVGSL